MRRSEFTALADHVFGSALAAVHVRGEALGPFGGRTPKQALDDGEDVRAVWTALCDAMDVPESERWEVPDPHRPRR